MTDLTIMLSPELLLNLYRHLHQGFQPAGGARQCRRELPQSEPDRGGMARLHQDGSLHGALHGRRLFFTGDGGSDDIRVRPLPHTCNRKELPEC